MTSLARQSLCRRHFGLDDLPDSISFMRPNGGQHPITRPIEAASVDDLAFAICGLEDRYGALGDQLFALRRLHNLARQCGGTGQDTAMSLVLRAAKTGAA